MPKNKFFEDRGSNGAGREKKNGELKSDAQAIENEVVEVMKLLKEELRKLVQYGRKRALEAYIEVVIDNNKRAGNKSRDVVLWRDETGNGCDELGDRSVLTPLMNKVMTRLNSVDRGVLYAGEIAQDIEDWYGRDRCDVCFGPGVDGRTQLTITPVK